MVPVHYLLVLIVHLRNLSQPLGAPICLCAGSPREHNASGNPWPHFRKISHFINQTVLAQESSNAIYHITSNSFIPSPTRVEHPPLTTQTHHTTSQNSNKPHKLRSHTPQQQPKPLPPYLPPDSPTPRSLPRPSNLLALHPKPLPRPSNLLAPDSTDPKHPIPQAARTPSRVRPYRNEGPCCAIRGRLGSLECCRVERTVGVEHSG